MSIQVQWFDEGQTIVRIDITDQYTINELHQAWATEREMMYSVSYAVYSLNVFQTFYIPHKEFKPTAERDYVSKRIPPNLQLTVQVAPNAMMRGILRTVASIMPHQVYVVPTVEEGLRLINSHKQGILES
ncbi:MAG: hypothetical protein ACOYLB_14215 [Phototrophicaceae bacterium]